MIFASGNSPRIAMMASRQNHERVVELTYRLDLRRGAYFIQPDFQYIVRPGGTGRLANAPVFGAQFGINF